MADHSPEVLREVFVAGLTDVHSVEHQALALIDRQLGHLDAYPEIAEQLQRHRGETEQQIARVEELLAKLDEKPSAIKEAALAVTGSVVAFAHSPGADAVLKNSQMSYSFESYEIAAYTSLIALAEAGYGDAVSALKTSLAEEQRMARWLEENNAAITAKHLRLRSEAAAKG